MAAPTKNKWLTLSLLAIILPVTLLVTFKLTGVIPEPLNPEAFEKLADGEKSVEVYVLCLEGVGVRRVENLSRVLEGVFGAARESTVNVHVGETWEYGPRPRAVFKEVGVNITVEVVTDWDRYKSLVELGSNVIIVNAHGEYLPVPSGYGREQWVDKIADFMMNRWGTWVHVAGYPFSLVHHQNGEVETWGEEGFKALMRHTGRENVNCRPPAGKENEIAGWDGEAHQQIGITWFGLKYWEAIVGKPLKCSDFKGYLLIWLYHGVAEGERYLPGAVVKFVCVNDTSSFGLYVHLGTWQFYDYHGHEPDADFAVGYITTAAAVWSDVGKSTKLLHEASDAIQHAQESGRTSGLREAAALLQQAVEAYNQGNCKKAMLFAEEAKELAKEAAKPNYLPILGAYVALVSVGAYGGYRALSKERKEKCDR
jgi:hypothetical protein